ncbi:HAD family phosphatase [Phenylobacterium sp.]|jgi:HAD superfamily hydrolase (TIGR01509 family)|uniref:HAD family hydrolase n=1 Tax=Phenylobacterium sp. TaxID=1871053 RepID=UPI002E2F1EBB|nr:HAD family phosphatase [Phenylobacterium sp.]HEX2561149.1 HAD family phosphatase [Phenylobacterium sp.]
MSLPRQVRAVVFDMDGLLFDTETLYFEAMKQAAAEIGREMPLDLFRSMVGLTGEGSAEQMRAHYGREFAVEAFWADSGKRFRAMAETQLCLKAGVVELLDHLDHLGLPRAIATSSGRGTVDHHLAAQNMTERFHAIVAHGDYERGKPAPDPYLRAAERLAVDPADCLALEDSHNGVRAASSAGMMTIMVPDLLDPTDEMHGLCVRIARDLHEVRGLLS